MENKKNSILAAGLVLVLLIMGTLVLGRLTGMPWKKPDDGPVLIEKEDRTPGGCEVIFITDTHILAESLRDDGTAFQEKMALDDGKITQYMPEVLDALTEEVVSRMPDALVVSGDLTLNGETASHQELAERLGRIRDQGVPVLVIPGNHDINNYSAAAFLGDQVITTDPVTPDTFLSIYETLGYQQAMSRDTASLSYIYEVDKKTWLMMLDTSIYDPTNQVHGNVKEETCQWMKQQLESARSQGIQVIPVGHHNLLPESRLYTVSCTIDNRQQVTELFEEYELPWYFSGHLHAARMRKNLSEPGMPEDQYAIHERVNSALSVPPCQYGIMTWPWGGEMAYETRTVDVDGWAARHGVTDENLLNFSQYSTEWYYGIISDQIKDRMRSSLDEEVIRQMAWTYADLLYKYSAGYPIDKREVRRSEGYRLWERFCPDDECLEEMEQILKDSM